jgi:dihydroxy-acid dehydratase
LLHSWHTGSIEKSYFSAHPARLPLISGPQRASFAAKREEFPMSFDAKHGTQVKLRSQIWFDNPDDPDMTALYIERYMNWGLTREELQSGKPLIGIAQSGSDLSPCNRHHIVLAQRVREGIREAGGIAFEFPVHPIQETGKRPTASLDRNLAYLGLVETLFGYPIDGVVLTTGCDKTTPSQLMAAATVNLPAIALSVGPMLNGWHKGQRTGSGTVKWLAKKLKSSGEIGWPEYFELVASSAPSPGFCNTMGTATTMNSLAEALGMMLPGCAAIPAPHKERGQIAYLTGRRIVEMVKEDLKPSQIMTREAFENAIVVNSAIGGSTNAPIHLNAIAAHLGIKLTNDDWERIGYRIPLLADMQPAGRFLGEDYHRAGGVPAVVAELLEAGRLPHPEALTVNGKTMGDNCKGKRSWDREVIRSHDAPILKEAGFLNLKGNLFESAIMKTSVISADFRKRYLSNPNDPEAFEGRAVVFDGREDYHARINDPALGIDENTILVIRGAGPVGYPGGAEVVNMQPPDALLQRGINELPTIGDGRQSGTSGSPSILNASPEAAVGGGLALVRTGDRVRIDLRKRTANILVSDAELEMRRSETRTKIGNGGLDYVPHNQTPWQEIQRQLVDQFDHGMVLKPAIKYRDVAHHEYPRDNH